MALEKKQNANQEMFEKFIKIVREELTDVRFTFGDDDISEPASKIVRRSDDGKTSDSSEGDTIKISAHKKVLAGSSHVFNAMFNGPLKETGDVKIVDVSPGAFQEFLQIFYEIDVKLSMDNLGDVMQLVDKYDVEAGWPFIDSFFKKFTVDDILWGLHLAVKYRRDDPIAHCTTVIEKNSAKVFDMIDVDDSGKPKLRSNPNSRPMTDTDLANIFSRVYSTIKKHVSESVKAARAVSLYLHLSTDIKAMASMQDISFSSNRTLLLTHITYSGIRTGDLKQKIQYDVKVCVAGIESTYTQCNGESIKCSNPVLIEANRMYTIQINVNTGSAKSPVFFARKTPEKPMQVAPDIQITFGKSHSCSFVVGMKFLRYDH